MAPTAFRPSAHQQRIFDFVRYGVGHGVVRATAGAGKTTTLVEIAKRLPRDLTVCFLAFNRHTAHELRERLPRHVRAVTIHALGRGALMRKHPRLAKVPCDHKKYDELIHRCATALARQRGLDSVEAYELRRYMKDLHTLGRHTLLTFGDSGAARALALRHNLSPPDDPSLEAEALSLVASVQKQGADLASRSESYDLTDMVHLPVAHGYPVESFDFVFVDEAQDLNAMQRELVSRSVVEGGRALYVGDPRQAIYGFTGADETAMPSIVERTNATTLPLSTTFRCPRLHVDLARRLAPEMSAAPDAIEGEVYRIFDDELYEHLKPQDLILCRYNAPVVRACYEALKRGFRATLKGGDLAERLVVIAEALYDEDLVGWADRLAAYEADQVARIERRTTDPDAAAAQILLRRDDIQCLATLTQLLERDGVRDRSRLIVRIRDLLAERPGTITFSTVHKMKGLEADRVFLLYPELMPAVYARTESAVHGEACVAFVALTRARHTLVFVFERPSPPESIELDKSMQIFDFIPNGMRRKWS